MNDDIDFFFPKDVSDEWNGFNDPGMEHFSGNPYVHVGKEVPQNSLDARTIEPIKLNIQVIEVPTSAIPGIDSLRQAMTYCQEGATAESDKAKMFFDNAVTLLQRPKVTVLKISDENTTGVEGPCENGRPYYAFMKATGQSKKSSEAGLGSFGIGKFAPFTVSELRTIFVSTIWNSDNSEQVHYVQGKAILMSHKDEHGATHKAVGYWGKKDACRPVEGPNREIPDWLTRDKKGTTLAILGFKTVKGWQKLLVASIAQNYFGAIADGRLEVQVGSIVLNTNNLDNFFKDSEVSELVKETQNDPEQFLEAGIFLSTVVPNQDVIVENTENFYLGNCELRIRVAENLPKKVAFLRDGMFITAELNRLKRFGDYKDFVAVFNCKSQKGNALLRAMEPPRHDDFEPQRLDAETQKKAKRALNDISSWVREMLKRHARDPVSEESTIDELAEYFGDEDASESERNSRSGDVNPRGPILIRARPIKYKSPASKVDSDFGGDGTDGQEGDGGGERGERGERGGGEGSRSGSGESGGDNGDGNTGSLSNITLENVRAIPLDSLQRRLFFVTRHNGRISLKLEVSGADTNERLEVVKASSGKISNGSIADIEVQSGQRISVDVILGRPFTGAVRVSAYAI